MSGRLIFIIIAAMMGTMLQASPPADTRTGMLHPSMRTLQVIANGNDQAPPIIMLGSDDYLTISFDELSTDRRYMRYQLLHCDAQWQPDQLVESEYIDGFNQADVDDYAFSRSTTVHYVNYRIRIPSEDMRIKLSGNYLLRVYDETDPDTPLLQARFMVLDPGMYARIGGSVGSRTDIDYNAEHQQLSLIVDAENIPVNDFHSEIIVKVIQNGRPDNATILRHPLYIKGSKGIYEHVPELIFPAGNEYRRMETVSVHYPSMHVGDISYEYPYYHISLMTDEVRATESYTFDKTQHGRMRVREYNSAESDVEADYVVTHFTLDAPLTQKYDIFIDGDMVQRRFDPQSLMVYNRATGLYENTMLLKQGAYNYQYLAVPHGSQTGLTAPVEGNFYQTINEYTILVYFRQRGARYDRLVGATVLKSYQ